MCLILCMAWLFKNMPHVLRLIFLWHLWVLEKVTSRTTYPVSDFLIFYSKFVISKPYTDVFEVNINSTFRIFMMDCTYVPSPLIPIPLNLGLNYHFQKDKKPKGKTMLNHAFWTNFWNIYLAFVHIYIS